VRLAGGLAFAFVAATALAGENVAIAAGIACVIAFIATLIPESPDDYPGYEVVRVALSQVMVGFPLIAVYASTFGAYVVPEHPKVASTGLVFLAAALRWHGMRFLRTIMLLALAVGAAFLVTASVSGSPQDVSQGPSRPWWGVALAAVAMVPVLVPAPGSSRLSRLGGFVLASLAVAVIGVGTVYQLGVDLAPTFLKDLLIAAELGSHGTALVVLIGIATVFAAVDTGSDAMIELDVLNDSWWTLGAGMLTTAAVAAYVPPVMLMILAGTGALVNAAIWWHIGYVWIKRSSYP
jgi:hypothetical protein